jgi:hypothetical protein
MATGNNVRLGGDIPRRCYHIRLDAKMDKPWRDRQYLHSDLSAWVSEHRAPILSAIFTIARAWFVAGQPTSPIKAIGSYESWSRVLGGFAMFGGWSDFLGNLDSMYEEADDEGRAWSEFLTSWFGQFGESEITCASIASWLRSHDSTPTFLPPELAERFENKAVSFERSLGSALRSRTGTIYDAWRIERGTKDAKANVEQWRVRRVSDTEIEEIRPVSNLEDINPANPPQDDVRIMPDQAAKTLFAIINY